MAELIILPSVRAKRGTGTKIIITKKYLEGVSELARYWPGEKATSLVEITDQLSSDLDHVEVEPGDLESGFEERPVTRAALEHRLRSAQLVLGFLSREQIPIADTCRKLNVPFVYIAEYAPETERQILRSNKQSFLKKMRGYVWLWRTEYLRRRAVRKASGLQCSGVPVYDTYRDLQPNTLLFFDNRVRIADTISEADINAKASALKANRPLRLIYGGRFAAMKGVMDLPRIAAALVRAQVKFTFNIYGDGPLKPDLLAQIEALGLQDVVTCFDPVDFRTEWTRVLKQDADLFVLCHPQGDPSSMYPEVMGCGVPLVGYDNAAFKGIVERSGCGWLSPVGDVDALAARIVELDRDRDAIADAILRGREFALEHAFEETFRRRAEHLVATMNA